MNQRILNVLIALKELQSPQEVEELQEALISVGVKLTYINAAQQSVQPTVESVRELPAVVIVGKSKPPAKSG